MTDRSTTEKLLDMLGDYFENRRRNAQTGAERAAHQMEAVDFHRLVRNWAEHNSPWGNAFIAELAPNDNSGPPTVPDWFLAAMRKAEERSNTPRRFAGERA